MPVAELLQDFIDMLQRTGRGVATNPPFGGQSQNFRKVAASADSACPDANFASGHQDGRKTDTFGRQANDKKRSRRAQARKRRFISRFCSGGHQRHMHAARERSSLATLVEAAFRTFSAPSDFANSSFSSETSMAVISAPISRAICTAKCPKPPIPKIARRCPGKICACCK